MKIPRFQTYWLYALIFFPYTAVFWLLERNIEPKYSVYCAADFYIPFIPAFAVFYFVWFAYIAVVGAYFMFLSKRDFMRFVTFLAIGVTFSYTVYLLFPNSQPLRPADAGDGVFGLLVSWLYSIDSPTNVCPSIHVINTLGAHFCVCKSEAFSRNARVKALSLFTAVMIIVSTMFIKQHSIIDVISGTAVAAAISAAFVIYEKRESFECYNEESRTAELEGGIPTQ